MSQSHYFSGIMRGGKIYETQGYLSDEQQIGVSLQVHNALQKEHDELAASYNEYQQKLIELGVIKVPLTPEQQIEKLTAMVEKQANTIEKLMERLDVQPDEPNPKSRKSKPNGEGSV